MKFKLLSATLLLISFGALGILSGEIPVRAGATGEPAEAADNTPMPTAEVTVPPETLPPAATMAPMATAEPTAAPTPTTAAENPWTPNVTVIATTITSDDPLDNKTAYDVDGSALLRQLPDISLSPDGPQILIVHTHATEAYTPEGEDQYESTDDYRTLDTTRSVVQVGQALADALEGYGLQVLHERELYDYPSYNGSYARSGAAIEAYLADYPTIQIVIDLHRDALGTADTVYKTVTDQEGVTAAQMMFVMGSDGSLSYPAWRENLAFAMGLQGLAQAQYPGLMRPTELCAYRYNQQLTPCSVLLEVGTAGNTLQEAVTAAELFARAVGPALAALVGA